MLSTHVIKVWVDEVAWETNNAAGYTGANAIPCLSPVHSGEIGCLFNKSSTLPPKRRGRKKHQKPLGQAVANGPVLNHMPPKKKTSLLQAPSTQRRTSPRNKSTSNNKSQPSLGGNYAGEEQYAMTDATPQLNLPLRPVEEPAKRGRGRPRKDPKSPLYSEIVAEQPGVTAHQRLILQQDTISVMTTISDKSNSRPSIDNRNDLDVVGIRVDEIETLDDLPDETQTLMEELRDVCQNGFTTIPAVICKQVEAAVEGKVRDHYLISQYHLGKKKALEELHNLRQIISDSETATSESWHESKWNTKIHHAILRLAIEDYPGSTMRARNTMGYDIIPDVSDIAYRKVDFCLTIEPGSPEQVQEIVRRQDPELQTFNQTYGVWRDPIAIAVKTKVETAPTRGEADLAIWTKGWLDRMCLLLGKPKGTSPNAPPLFMLRVQNYDWFVLVAYYNKMGISGGGRDSQTTNPSGSKLIILSEQPIGSTRDLVSTYRLLRCLRLLAGWAEGEFRTYIDKVVVPGAMERLKEVELSGE